MRIQCSHCRFVSAQFRYGGRSLPVKLAIRLAAATGFILRPRLLPTLSWFTLRLWNPAAVDDWL